VSEPGNPLHYTSREIGTSSPLPAPSSPMAVARKLVTDFQSDGHLTLRRWRGGWMQWRDGCWREVEEAVVRGWLYRKLEHASYVDDSGKGSKTKDWEPNRHKVTDVADALTAIIHLAEDVSPPAWLAGDSKVPAGEIVACTNGLLHVGTRKLISHTPRFFNTTSVPFDYDPAAPKPVVWLKFLAELWPDDPAAVAALQQFFGYVLSGRTDLHKILLLIGPTRSGKGTIARILTALVGDGNAAGPTLASLATNFGLMPLLGKPLAVISDARLGGANVHQVVERLLSVSGEDMLTVDRKYRAPWTGKLPTRFILLSNELPRFGDASGAIAARFIVLTMTISFLGKENSKLTGQLLAELPGILAWSLDGLDQLAKSGALTAPKSSADAILALQDLVSPVSAFVRDYCERGGEVAVTALFEAWRQWCELNSHKPGSAQVFGRDLRAVVPVLRVVQPRVGETRPRRYVGLHLRGPEDNSGADPPADTSTPAHNGADRVPSRATRPEMSDSEPVARDGTRENPLRAEVGTSTFLARCTQCGRLAGPGGILCPKCKTALSKEGKTPLDPNLSEAVEHPVDESPGQAKRRNLAAAQAREQSEVRDRLKRLHPANPKEGTTT
jgi:putative DNA primase/helicase